MCVSDICMMLRLLHFDHEAYFFQLHNERQAFFPFSKYLIRACLAASINSPKLFLAMGGGAPPGPGWTQVGRAAWDGGEERRGTLKGAERRSV